MGREKEEYDQGPSMACVVILLPLGFKSLSNKELGIEPKGLHPQFLVRVEGLEPPT